MTVLGAQISQEMNTFVRKSFENVKTISKREDEGSHLTLSEFKKKSSVKSQMSEIFTPSKMSSSPQSKYVDRKLEFKLGKNRNSFKAKNLNLDLVLINKTP